MKVTVGIKTEVLIVETKISIQVDSGDYDYKEDEKWRKFCKDHNFHPIRDYGTRVYDLYLRLCGVGLIQQKEYLRYCHTSHL